MNAELRARALHRDRLLRRALACASSSRGRPSRRTATAPSARTSSRPIPTPTTGARYEPLMAAIKARGWSVLMTISGPGAEVGDEGQARRQDAAEPVGVRGVRDRRRAQVRRPGRHVGDLERAQPAAVPAPAVRRAAARRRRRRSTATSTSPASAGWRSPGRATTGSSSPRRRRAATATSSRRCASCAACSASTTSTRSARSAARWTPTATPTTPTRRARGRSSRRPQKDDVTIGVLSRLTKALDRARTRRRVHQAPADLPHRVRHPVHARHPAGRVAQAAGPVPRDLRADRLEQPARRRVLAVPADRQRADRAQAVRRLRVGPALRQRQGRSRRWPASACRSPSSGPARRSRSGASCGRRRAPRRRRSPTPTAAAPSRSCAPSRPTRAATSRSARRGARAGAGTSRGRAGPARPSSPTRAP